MTSSLFSKQVDGLFMLKTFLSLMHVQYSICFSYKLSAMAGYFYNINCPWWLYYHFALAYWYNSTVLWKFTLMMMQLACSDNNATRWYCGSAPFSEADRRTCSWSGFVYSYFAFPRLLYRFQAYISFIIYNFFNFFPCGIISPSFQAGLVLFSVLAHALF